MKVIESKPWTLPFTCICCQAKLEADAADVHYSTNDDESFFWVECPNCETTRRIQHNTVPPMVQKAAMAKRGSR